MSIKKYILTIEYNTNTEEIEYIQEELIDDEAIFEYGDITINEYFDEDTLEMLEGIYILGIS